MITMAHDELRSLLAGYALGILDEEEKNLIEAHLPTCANCQAELKLLQQSTADLALSVEPVELPEGHLERFRAKTSGLPPTLTIPAQTPPVPNEGELEQARARRNQRTSRTRSWLGNFNVGWRVAYAAALLLFLTAAVFGYLLLDANNRLSEQERNNQLVIGLLAAPDLKVTELQPTGAGQPGSARLLADSANNRAALVSYNLQNLPEDKAYQVWVIGADGKPQSAAVFSRSSSKEPAIVALAVPGSLSQYKLIAVTVEQRGGSPTGLPTTNPFTAGNLS